MNNDLGSAINQVIKNYDKMIPDHLDFSLFVSECAKELKAMDIPYYSIKMTDGEDKCVTIATPFLKSCQLCLDDTENGTYCILHIDNKDVRKIKLSSTTPEYARQLANAMMDYFKRFLIFKNSK